jgi:hypothetical protein
MSMRAIFYGQPYEALFYGDESDGADIAASHRRFCEVLKRRIQRRWPAARVEVSASHACSVRGGDSNEVLRQVSIMADQLRHQEPDAWRIAETP